MDEILIPMLGEENTVPDMSEVNIWRLADKRTYFVDYEIDEAYRLVELYKEIVRINIEDKDNPNPKPITLYIHSFGGDISQAMAFVDLVQTSHVPVITVAMGAAMSSGLLIFLAGKKRFLFPHSALLIHGGYSSLSGTTDQVEKAQKFTKKQDEQIKAYILGKTKIAPAMYNKHKREDWFILADEAIELGIADAIVNNFTEVHT